MKFLPSESDLINHVDFIREAVKRDRTLQKSKVLASLLEGRTRKGREFDQNDEAIMKPSFIVDDIKIEYEDYDKESDVEDDIYDTVCAICDNGGDLTDCEGKCLRAFHATLKSAKSAKSYCKSLCLPANEVKYVEVVPHMEKQRRAEQILRSEERGSKIIIFCSTKKLCDQLTRSIGRNFGAAAIHGDKSQGERDYVLNQFRAGKARILVATDVAAYPPNRVLGYTI